MSNPVAVRKAPPATAPIRPKSFFYLPSDAQLQEVRDRARRVRIVRQSRVPEAIRGLSPRDLQAEADWLHRDFAWYFAAWKAGVPRRHWQANLDGVIQTAAVKAARRFVDDDTPEDPIEDDEPSCIALLGPAGVGKTFAGVGILRSQREGDLQFYDVRALSRLLMNPESREATMERALTAQALMLDDVGATYLKADSFLESLLEEIFIHREGRPCETILTSNLTATQLASVVGLRVADRLFGPWATVHELPGESLRRPRA